MTACESCRYGVPAGRLVAYALWSSPGLWVIQLPGSRCWAAERRAA